MEENKEKIRIDKWKIVAVVCVAVAVIAALGLIFLLGGFFGEGRESESKMEELRVDLESESRKEAQGEAETLPGSSEETAPKPLEKNPYGELFAQNEDMAFWLVVEGTAIDYPAMQTPEDEN